MNAAKKKDRAVEIPQKKPTEKKGRVITVRILRSLPPEHEPTTVLSVQRKQWLINFTKNVTLSTDTWPEGLSSSSDLPEILWNLILSIHDTDQRQVLLAQNPNFYNTLPTSMSPAGYMRIQPIEFPDNSSSAFDVLTNNGRRVYFDRKQEPRFFDGLWFINGTPILRGSCSFFFSHPD